MTAKTIILRGDFHRDLARMLISNAPEGWAVTVKEPTRTLEQNALLHAMLGDISRQCPMGWKKTPDTWKAILLHACGHEVQFEMGLDGQPFPMGLRTSNLSVRQMSELIEFMYAFGAERNIVWSGRP